MNNLIEFCYSTMIRKAVSPERPSSPSPFRFLNIEIHDCSNLCCLQTTKTLKEWKRVEFNKRSLYFCSEDCWEEWIQSPSQIGCWSPPIQPAEATEMPETLSLDD